MINKIKLQAAMTTLLYSWGGDTPPEAIWAFNEIVEALNMKTRLKNENDIESDFDTFTNELKSINFCATN